MTDFHTVFFSDLLATLEPYPPIVEAMRAELAKRGPLKHDNERDHMSDWFYSQVTLGYGQYSRRRPNISAQVTYNRLLSATGLVWISEALEIDLERSQAAAKAALELRHPGARAGAVRRFFPWEVIAPAAQEVVEQSDHLSLQNRNY